MSSCSLLLISSKGEALGAPYPTGHQQRNGVEILAVICEVRSDSLPCRLQNRVHLIFKREALQRNFTCRKKKL